MEDRVFTAPEATFVYFPSEDVIAASGGTHNTNIEEGDPWTSNY